MKKLLILFIVFSGFLNANAQNYPDRYNGGEATLITAPNGAITNAYVAQNFPQVVYSEKTVDKVTDGVWVIGGYSIANCTVIKTPRGLVVFDTGDFGEEGEHFLEAIRSHISKDDPIIAIIYSHSHYALGGGAMVDDPSKVMVIGHPKLNETVEKNLKGGGLPGSIPEIGPVLTARASVQFSNYLPLKGEDATLANRLQFKEPAFLPVTDPVQDGQILNIGGLDIQFFTKYKADDYSVTVWIPEKKTCLTNFYWPGTVNLYSLRGAEYRDPQEWRDGLKVVRNLQPEFLVSTHAKAVKGNEEVLETINNYMDMITLTYDQSLRGILKGLGPDDLRYFVYTPERLSSPPYNKQLYGETQWFTPAIYYFGMGWYDRDPSKLYQLPPKDEAQRLIKLMGGMDKVIAAAKTAFDNKEYAWTAQLIHYAYLVNPQDKEVRKVYSDALRKLGQLATSSIGRSFTMSTARALDGKETIPIFVLPNAELIAKDPAKFVNYFRVRIDPEKSENTDKVITFTFTDNTVGLHVRKGIVEYIDDPKAYYRSPDIDLKMDGMTWAKLYLNQTDLAQEIKSGKVKVTKGDASEMEQIFEQFDKFLPEENTTVPPVSN
jgi:linear primary-alkylsulfatase